jgi:hypothetical protein
VVGDVPIIMKSPSSSLYPPPHPRGSHVLARFPASDATAIDRLIVYASSISIVGAVVWIPAFYGWAWKRFQSIPKDQTRRRAAYAMILLAGTGLFAVGPHRHPSVGRWLHVKKWGLWKSWIRFLAMEIVADSTSAASWLDKLRQDPAIVAISPHGIFPFGLAIPSIAATGQQVFGTFRPVVASATGMYPLVRDFLSWLQAVYVS